MTSNTQDLATEEAKAIAVTAGELYNTLADTYQRLYQIQASLKCAIPGLEKGSAPAIDATHLCSDLVGELAEKLDLLCNRL